MPQPRTPRDVLTLPPIQRIAYGAVIRLAELSGLWRHGRDGARGDLERMTRLDLVYWVYKTRSPIRRARRGSQLEEYFAPASRRACALPDGLEPSSSVSISAAGDLIHHPWLARSRDALYADVEELLFDVDLSMANLECVAEPPAQGALVFDVGGRKGPRLTLDGAELDAVVGHRDRRFGFLATACNHSLDCGPEGVDGTIAALDRRGIDFHGIYRRGDDPRRPTIVARNGVRIGVVAWTFGLNAHVPPADRPEIVAVMDLGSPAGEVDLSPLCAQITACRAAAVDFVIAHLHWGLEHELYPTPDQVELAHRIAELGVDAIVGHHPHVIQPWETYRTRRDPERLVPIAYSLGNLVNGFTAPWLCRGGVLRLELAKGTYRGEARTYVRACALHEVEQVLDEARETIRIRPAT